MSTLPWHAARFAFKQTITSQKHELKARLRTLLLVIRGGTRSSDPIHNETPFLAGFSFVARPFRVGRSLARTSEHPLTLPHPDQPGTLPSASPLPQTPSQGNQYRPACQSHKYVLCGDD